MIGFPCEAWYGVEFWAPCLKQAVHKLESDPGSKRTNPMRKSASSAYEKRDIMQLKVRNSSCLPVLQRKGQREMVLNYRESDLG